MTGGPVSTIFPDLTPGLRRLAFGDLAEERDATPVPVGHEEVMTLVRHRLAAVASRNARHVAVDLEAEELALLEHFAFEGTRRSLAVLHASRDALDLLAGEAIPFVISKGPGIAVQIGQRAERGFTDVDVLVTPGDFRRSMAALDRLGYGERPDSRQPWGYFDRHCREAVNLESAGGGRIDLHHRIPPWLWTRRFDVRALIARRRTCDIGGLVLPVLRPVDNLMVSVLHVVTDRNDPGATLMPWRDLLLLAAAVDPDEALSTAERYGLSDWLGWVVRQIPEDLQPRPLVAQLPSRPPARHRRRFDHVVRPGSESFRLTQYAFRLPLPNACAFAAGMAVPSRAFLERKYPRTRHRYLRWWRTCLGWDGGVAGDAGRGGEPGQPDGADGAESATPASAGHRPVQPEILRPLVRRVYYDGLVVEAGARGALRRADPGWLVRRPPVFVVGCGRSGTTILAEVLARHPDVHAFVEPYAAWAAIDRRTDFLGLFSDGGGHVVMGADMVDQRVRGRFARILAPGGGSTMVEKSPVNCFRIGYLQAIAPDARYVHIVRDEVPVVRSVVRVAARSVRVPGRGVLNDWWGVDDRKWRLLCRDLPRLGMRPLDPAVWLDDAHRGAVEWAASLRAIVAWEPVLGDRMLTVRYDDLTSDPRAVLDTVARHLGLSPRRDWIERCVRSIRPARRDEAPAGEVDLPVAVPCQDVADHFGVAPADRRSIRP